MQLSRSLFAVIAMSSLLSLPAKANETHIPWKLVGAGALGLTAGYLQKRQVNNNTDLVSKGLNTGSRVVQGLVNLVKENAVPAAVAATVAFLAYHNKHVHNTGLGHQIHHFLHQHKVV